MGKFKIKLETGDQFWTPKGLGALGMDPHRAIAELVANSLDWRRDNDEKAVITITIGRGFIEVKDTGVGMNQDELKNAIKVSVANDTLRKNLRIRKGMFGMGMKVACLTLGWKITFNSRSINEKNILNKLVLDTRKFDNPKEDYRNKINGDSEPIKKGDVLYAQESGTSIRIEDLTYKSLVGISIRDSLQEVFKPEIVLENIEIIVIDEKRNETLKCSKIDVPIIAGTRINLDELNLFVLNKETKKKKKIKGWLGLMTTSRPSGDWGIHLYRNNQIIERFHQLPSRLGGLMPKNPHAEFSRTYGEIELEMCAPAFHKVGFDYSTEEWKQVQTLLNDHLTSIMEASRDYKIKDIEKAGDAIKKLQKHTRASKKATKKLRETSDDVNKPEEAITLPDGRWFTIVPPIFKELNEEVAPWIYNYSKASRELAILINTKSPVYTDIFKKGLDDKLLDTLVNWSISECLFFLLVEIFDYNNEESLNFRNNLLKKLYSL